MIEIHHSYVARVSGKANATFRWLAENPDKIPLPGKQYAAVTVYVTSRSEIQNLDFSRFVASFGPHLKKVELRRLKSRILFTVYGYDDTELELFEIPEVRRFYGTLQMI